LGWGNYNGLFVTFRIPISNFKWGRSLSTGQIAQYNSAATPLFPLDIGGNYGPQGFDVKFIYNLSM
jgi:hypothetical protein